MIAAPPDPSARSGAGAANDRARSRLRRLLRVYKNGLGEVAFGAAGPLAPAPPWAVSAIARAHRSPTMPPVGRTELRRLVMAGCALLRLRQDERARKNFGQPLIYQGYVAAVVKSTSPLLVRLCDHEGYDLADLASRLRMGSGWRQWLCGTRAYDLWVRSLPAHGGVRPTYSSQRRSFEFEGLVHGGLVVHETGCPRIPFGIRVLGSGLEMACFLGEHRLRTHGATGSLTVRLALPETLVRGLPGFTLDQLVDHPLLAGAGCVITQVDGPNEWGTKVHFALEPVPWRVPWAELGRSRA